MVIMLSCILWIWIGYYYHRSSIKYTHVSPLPFQLQWEERNLFIPYYGKEINYFFGQWNPIEVGITNSMRDQMSLIKWQILAWQSTPDSNKLQEQYGFTLEELEQFTYTGTTPFAWYNQIVTPETEQALLSFLSSESLRYVVENCYWGFVRYGHPMWRDDTVWIEPHWVNINDFLIINPYIGRKQIQYELIDNVLYQITNDNISIKECLQEKRQYDKVKEELESLYTKLRFGDGAQLNRE